MGARTDEPIDSGGVSGDTLATPPPDGGDSGYPAGPAVRAETPDPMDARLDAHLEALQARLGVRMRDRALLGARSPTTRAAPRPRAATPMRRWSFWGTR